MTFKRGDKKPPNSGRKKGQVSKITTEIKQAFADSLASIDKTQFFIDLAASNPTTYAAFAAKFLPAKIQTEFTIDEDVGKQIEEGRKRALMSASAGEKTIDAVVVIDKQKRAWSPFDKTGESK